MAVDDNSYDIRDLPDLMLDDFDKNFNTTFPNFSDYTESQLCIPQDPIEDLEWYPNFNNDIISLNGIVLTPEHETLDFGFNFKPSNQSENIFSTNFPLTPEPLNEPENIFSTNFPLTPEQNTENTEENKRVPLKDCFCYDNKKRGIEGSTSFANKKQRSKRVSKGAWSIKDVFFAFENEGPSERMQRRCTHCLTDQTPQWRVGPMGPRTLCNACGVRYKSGRLVPEYRPAASPTFDCHKHSNFHKKILKKKGLSLSD